MTEYWFKPKRYGYGATPVTWQGWLLTFAMPGFVVAATVTMAALGGTANAVNWIVLTIITIAIIALSIVFIYRKTDGEWRWRWGDDDS